MGSLDLNVVIFPDESIQQYSISLSGKIRENFKTNFVLNKSNILPHITLYQAGFPSKNFDEIKNNLESICQDIKPFDLAIGSVSEFMCFIFLNVSKTTDLANIQGKIVKNLNFLREGVIIEDFKGMLEDKNLSVDIRQNIKAFGSPLIGKSFIPHITLTKIANPQDAKSLPSLFKTEKKSFKAKSIALTNVSAYGTVSEIYKEFEFKGNYG